VSVTAVGRVLYGLWAWGLFALVASSALILALLAPTLMLRRRIARGAAHLFLKGAAIPLSVSGLERLPEGPCVVVANHASYIDGVVMQAALPPRLRACCLGAWAPSSSIASTATGVAPMRGAC
jgi:1-acyl-sn-glycerol-3-phosphate acyltransferase